MSETAQIEKPVVSEAPKAFSDIDHLRVLLSNEKMARLDAQIYGLQAQLQMAQRDQEEAKKERDVFLKSLWAQYSMTEADTMDVKTGMITRNGAAKSFAGAN